MKLTVLFIAILTLSASLKARASDYRSALEVVHEQFYALEIERYDYRKPIPHLSPLKEEERFKLLGRLLSEDPVWSLTRELQADIDTLVSTGQNTQEERNLLEKLKDLLAISSSFLARSETRE